MMKEILFQQKYSPTPSVASGYNLLKKRGAGQLHLTRRNARRSLAVDWLHVFIKLLRHEFMVLKKEIKA